MSHDVDVPGGRPRLFVQRLTGIEAVEGDTGVGAVHVDGPTERVPGVPDDRRGITGHGDAPDLVRDMLGPLGVQVIDDDPGTLGGEAPGKRGSDTTTGPRDNDSSPLKGSHHRSP